MIVGGVVLGCCLYRLRRQRQLFVSDSCYGVCVCCVCLSVVCVSIVCVGVYSVCVCVYSVCVYSVCVCVYSVCVCVVCVWVCVVCVCVDGVCVCVRVTDSGGAVCGLVVVARLFSRCVLEQRARFVLFLSYSPSVYAPALSVRHTRSVV